MMKKIAIFTWLHNGNYGSILQAFALQKFLRNQGYDVVDFDYNASIKTKLINWWKNKNSPKLFLKKISEAKEKRAYSHPELFEIREKKFQKFLKENMNLTKLYRNSQEISDAAKDYEIFICGSDQIWSPALMNPVYYLALVPEKSIKIAYAPSFGVIETTNAKKRKIKNYLKNFKYISVREIEGQALVKELIKEDVPIQVDPTMLIEKKEWVKFAGKRIMKEKYILCYLLTPNSIYIQCVKDFASKVGLSVIIIPTIKGPFKTGFIEAIDVGPLEWINYIQNADFVFTDSFHGCIFSSIFESNFVLFKRFSDNDKDSENSRVYTLTKLLGVEERLIDASNIDLIDKLKPIDFNNVKNVIELQSNKSKKWLLNILSKECK